MGRHVAERPRTRRPWPAMAAALVLIMSTGAAPPRHQEESPVTKVTGNAVTLVTAAAVPLVYDRTAVSTEAAPPAPAPFQGLGLAAYVERYAGRYTILPGYSTAECVAIFSEYHYQAVRGEFYTVIGAKDLWHPWDEYTRVPPDAPAQPGDVAVWAGDFGAYQGGGYGHVAIVITPGTGTITALSQNPGPARVMELSRSGLLGFLRPHQLNL